MNIKIIRIVFGVIALRPVKTDKSSVMKIFDDLGGLYRTAIMVGEGSTELNSQQFKARLIR